MAKKNEYSNIDFIEDNPFYKNIEHSPSALWILENEDKVKKKIHYTLSKMGNQNYEIDECYDYMAYYFIEFSHNEFDQNYFDNAKAFEALDNAETLEELEELENMAKKSNDDYKLEYYVLNRVHSVALGFVRGLNRLKSMQRFETSETLNDSRFNKSSNVITMDEASASSKKACVTREDAPELICEFMELQDILENDLHIYDEDFRQKGLRNFATRPFIEAMFLADLEETEEIAKIMGVSKVFVDNYSVGFRALVKNELGERGEYKDLLESIKMLIEGKRNGWIPCLSLSM